MDENETPGGGVATADPATRLADVVENLSRQLQERDARVEQLAQEAAERAVGTIAGGGAGDALGTPSRRTVEPTSSIRTRFDQMGYTRADYELCMMLMQAGRSFTQNKVIINPPDDLVRGWRHHVFETEGGAPWVVDNEGKPVRRLDPTPWAEGADYVRAMDTAETGFGLELVGVDYANQLWEAARNNDGILEKIPTVPMGAASGYVPIDGDLPEMLFVGESTTNSASNYGSSKTGSGRAALSAKKFTIQSIWSGELDEDALITYTPFIRRNVAMSAALYSGSAMYNGDNTNAGTGNINSDDADPADTKHYLAFDGIRHYWLVDATGQGKDMAGALDIREITRARGKLNAGDDDVDNLIKNINWGIRAQDLLCVTDWDTYMGMLNFDEVRTLERYGALATIVTGELGRVDGIPIISPSYASKTEADGKASTTEASNTKGQVTVFNPGGFLAGVRRETQLFFDRIQRTDQFLLELYTRRGFTRFGGNVAAGVYNITP